MRREVGEAVTAGRRLSGGRGLAVAILVAGLAGCNTFSPGADTGPTAAVFSGVGGSGLRVDSREHARIVGAYGGVYHNDEMEQTLVPIVSRIVASSDRPDQAYRITILNSPAVNAFALPGGYLYVTRGLLALANDSSEVAAVLAHEMAHVTADHAVERQNRARNALIVSRVVNDVLDGEASGQLALASSQRSLATFSRQQELEADALGVRTIGKAGYDPHAAARFLSSMSRYASYRQGLAERDQQPGFLSSHPTTPDRVLFAERAAREFGAPGIGTRDRDRYLDGIDGMAFGDDPSQGFVRDRTYVHPELRVAFTAPEGFVIDNAREAVLATGADGTALRFDSVSLARRTELADYLRSGWINGLDDASISSFSVNGLKAASARAAAKGWHFQIAVIQVKSGATYRFILANEAATPTFEAAARATVESFRTLSDRDADGYRALRIKVIEARRGDTLDKLAGRMHGVDRPRELFLALNGLTAAPEPGTKVKIVTDR